MTVSTIGVNLAIVGVSELAVAIEPVVQLDAPAAHVVPAPTTTLKLTRQLNTTTKAELHQPELN